MHLATACRLLLLLAPTLAVVTGDVIRRTLQASATGISPVQCVLQDPLEPVQCCEEVEAVCLRKVNDTA